MGGRIPTTFVDQLLSRVDIVEIIDSRIPLRKVGREFAACCPFHTERTPSFTVSPQKQFYHCFGCGVHGSAIGFLMAYEYLSFQEAVDDLARTVGLEVPREGGNQRDDHSELLSLVTMADHFYRRQLREHPKRQHAVDYLQGRGLTGETVAQFGIGYAPEGRDNLSRFLSRESGVSPHQLLEAGLVGRTDDGQYYDRFRNRVVFPIRSRRGQTIAFGARAMGSDTTPKYLNSPETSFFHKGQELYGLFEARRKGKLSKLLVVEGYMDVVMLAQHDIPYAVATLGTATTTAHAERLFRLVPDVIFCFDGDAAGRQAAWRALENSLPALKDGRQASFLFLPHGDDPDSLVNRDGKSEFENLMAQSLPLSEYFFERLCSQVNLHTHEGKARLAELARPLINKLPDSDFRDLMGEQLKALTGLIRTRLEDKTPSGKRAISRSPSLSRSPVRLAIALLLHAPSLARQVSEPGFLGELEIPGITLLLELIELIQNRPHINNAAALLSHFEGTEKGEVLNRLLQGRLLIDPDNYGKEFFGILKQLQTRHRPDRQLYDDLIRKGGFEALSEQEKEKLLHSSKKGQ